MKNIFIVHHHYHSDDNKKSNSKSRVEKIFYKKEDAYEYCVEKLTVYFKEYTVLEEMSKDDDKENEEDDDEDYNQRIKILYSEFKDKTKSFFYRYNIVLKNFKIFFGKPEFGILPTHDFWYISEKEIEI